MMSRCIDDVTEDEDRVPEFVRNRIAMQEEHMETIRNEFEGQVRAVAPLYHDELRGVPALERAATSVFS